MIDIENEIYTVVKNHVGSLVEGSSTTSNDKPPKFPFLCVELEDNSTYNRTRSSDCIENHVKSVFKISIYSEGDTKKSDAKKVANSVDEKMQEYGFSRSFGFQEVPNLSNTSIFRYIARYQAIVGKDNKIYSI